MRIRPPAEGEPFHNPDIPAGMIHIANRAPGEKSDFEAREVIDPGFLELVRYGVRRADDPLIIDSLKVVDHVLKIDTPYGPCWRRYNHDGYGQRKDGGPYIGYGQGRAWPLLTGERAHFELAAGNDIARSSAPSKTSPPSAACSPSRSGTTPTCPPNISTAAAPPAPPSRSAGPTPSTSSSSAPSNDNHIFDRISVVEERYAVPKDQRKFQSRMEIFRTTRPISAMVCGGTLRIIDPEPFQVLWTTDNWATKTTTDARPVDGFGAFADLTAPAQTGGQTGVLSFTLFWPASNRWLGRNYDVTMHSEQPAQMPASRKPEN